VKINNLLKYLIRFLFLQILITFLTIWFFDKYLVLNEEEKYRLYLILVEDRNRFLPFIPMRLVSINTVLSFLTFTFLIVLYSTNFYTYVNELKYTFERRYFDDYINIYLLWNSFLFSSFFIFRFTGLSRGNLLLFTFIVPFVLILFRNSELLSTLLGRSTIKENFLTFNLEEESLFRNLRIMSFRNNKGAYFKFDSDEIINKIDEANKLVDIHLIVINVKNDLDISENLENYLLNLNKKVLIISDKNIQFKKNFIYRNELINNKYFHYFNNDIQYGSKYILKRFIDLSISLIALFITSPMFFILISYIYITDGSPTIIKQKRVGLHGKSFNMYKLRTMKRNSHELRESLEVMNKKSGPLFKIDNDPRLIKGALWIRKYSLDELPQLINVIFGNMSLVGPRPLFDTDTQLFDTDYMRRLNVMPGMTGLLQINERNADDFETWFKYDVEYIENWSLYLDLKIILKTIPSLFNKKVQGL